MGENTFYKNVANSDDKSDMNTLNTYYFISTEKIIQVRKNVKTLKGKEYVHVISRCRYTGSALPSFQISTHYIRCLLIISDFITLYKYFWAG